MQLIESQFISSKSMVVDNNVHMQEVFIIGLFQPRPRVFFLLILSFDNMGGEKE